MNANAIQYHDNAKHSTSARYHVAASWIDSKPANGTSSPQFREGPTYSTDGSYLWSYRHIVGVTLANGDKLAYGCHYSATTTKQLGPARAMADKAIDFCPTCQGCKYPDLQPKDDAELATMEAIVRASK